GVAHVHFVLDSDPEVADSTIDGSFQFTNVPPGSHVLTGYLIHSAPVESGATPITFTVVLPETVNPTVSITAPSNGASVSGTVQLTATASDNVGVAGVQFLLDGLAIGSEDLTAPYA